MKLITLLTDFGVRDGYVGVMKGVIWNICPGAHIADITHTISPQNVREGALVLSLTYPYYPKGTVHVAVVDPGVGTHRRAIAARVGGYYFVAPDNGLLSPVLDQAEKRGWPVEIINLTRPEYWLREISHVFHGRDIFSPVGAHLAAGVPLRQVGEPITDPLRFTLPEPKTRANGVLGQVILRDNYGNLSTNIPLTLLDQHDPARLRVRVAGQEIAGMNPSFGFGKPGDLVAVRSTFGTLLIARVNDNAAAHLGVGVGEPVEVLWD